MKKHWYKGSVTVRSPHWMGNKYWIYDKTLCGLMRDRDDFHQDRAESLADITCVKCKTIKEVEDD
jgi:hypothetical protein